MNLIKLTLTTGRNALVNPEKIVRVLEMDNDGDQYSWIVFSDLEYDQKKKEPSLSNASVKETLAQIWDRIEESKSI